MRILLSNDDGVFAEGLRTLYQALSLQNEVTVIAPDRNCSGASNSLTLSNPLRVTQHDNGFYSVNGTPTDCVHIGINQLCKQKPDIVVSGINHGANLGDDVIYSGTVAAATEGRHMGLPAVAVSLVDYKNARNFEDAAQMASKIISQLDSHPLANDQILNINVPPLGKHDIKGIQTTRCGRRHQAETMVKTLDPFGRDIYWYGPVGGIKDSTEGTDFAAISNGFVSVTPLTVDMTAYKSIKQLEHWLAEIEI
ncbi:acid phosphatase surE [Catenovulum agarivorans DS-2]|uniref:5'-nucleotidase SurE n=1 Tax=Catenovulum agarivorans DS-2 TaxID=1328313 RepID=W7Q7C4_9ALTE|nr:5'/3'-nucleotidase SurE [Catenovulum agarivorans]EWH08669.1 acid phosphatase surE [Catenovulum agarivorans DS-2]